MEENWKKVKLGEITSNIQTGPFGSQLHMSDYSDEGTPVVMPKDIINGKISESSIARVSENHVKRLNRYVVFTGNILYARRGDVGKCAYVSEKENGWLCGTGCLNVESNLDVVDSKFLFFQLQTPETVGWIQKNAVGATMLNLNTEILSRVPISLPPLETQQKIASILSAYDDLIENNRKQIKLLEEAAQRLYKEWFVDLRFPGYENVAIVDGLPEGWRIGTLGEIGEFKRGKTITKAQAGNGKIPVVAGGIEPAYYTDKSNTSAPVITISASGNAGFVKIYFSKIWASDCSFLDMETNENLYYIYSFLKANQTYIYSLQKGACQQHVYAKDINAIELIIPNMNIICDYVNTITPYFEKIEALQKQIQLLQQARDKLLPRLMSGEMEV